MSRTKKSPYRSIRLGEARVGMRVHYLNDLHLPPIAATIIEVGKIQQGGFQKYQDIRLHVHEWNRKDFENIMESGSERVLIKKQEKSHD